MLTGPTGKVCPGDQLQYTCERVGITNPDEPLIVWDFYLNGVRVRDLRIGITVRELNESMSVQLEGGRTLMGNISSSGTVVAVLQVNASSVFNTVDCIIRGPSNNSTISIRGERVATVPLPYETYAPCQQLQLLPPSPC